MNKSTDRFANYGLPRLTGVLTLAGALISTGAAMAQGNMKVTVRKAAGQVQVSSGGAWTKATVGQKLLPGTKVKTGPGGEAILTWDNGNVLKIRPLTQMTIAALTKVGATTDALLTVKKGSVFAKVKKLKTPNSSFIIGTPTAVAGVRGTSEEVGEDGVKVIEGEVQANELPEGTTLEDLEKGEFNAEEFQETNEGMSLEEGEQVETEGDGLGEKEDIPEEEMNELKEEQEETEQIAEEVKDDTATTEEKAGEEEEGEESEEENKEESKEDGEEAEEEGATEEETGAEEGGGEVGEVEEFDTDALENLDNIDELVNDTIEGVEDAEEIFEENTGSLDIIIE